MIGEDGRMTEAAGRFAGLDRRRGARRRWSRRSSRRAGSSSRSPTRTRCRSRTAPASAIEPLISLQWFMRMDELAAPAIEVVRVGPRPLPSRALGARSTSTGSRTSGPGASRASCGGATGCRSGTATPATRRTSARSRPSAAASATASCAATRTCSTPGSPRRCGRSRRSAGRSDTPELRAFYPTDVLVTARDIIFLWVARMVMMGLEFPGDVPFEDVFITSIIQAPDGRRMSKSLGTGIDPLDEIEAHGADAVRFGLLAMSSSQDVRYSAEKIQQGQQLANKMWNASRLVLTEGGRRRAGAAAARPSRTAGSCRACSARSSPLARGSRATTSPTRRSGLYSFFYGELCDWYLEMVEAAPVRRRRRTSRPRCCTCSGDARARAPDDARS